MVHLAGAVPFRDFRAALDSVRSEFSAVLGLPASGGRVNVLGLSSPGQPRTGTMLFSMSAPGEALLGLLEAVGRCVVVVPPGYGSAVAALGHVALEAERPKYAFARLARALVPLAAERGRAPGSRSPLAAIEDGALIRPGATLEEFVSVASSSEVGEDCYLMRGCSVGPRVRLGRGCVIKENAVIGDMGFGFGLAAGRPHARIPQLGGVDVGEKVEIGANSTVGAGTLAPTRIGSGTKISNHVHVAHNCAIGAGTIIACGVNVSGSVTIGERCWIAPGATLRNKITIGDGATIGLGAVVVKDVPEGDTVAGVPARPVDKPGPWYESESGTP